MRARMLDHHATMPPSRLHCDRSTLADLGLTDSDSSDSVIPLLDRHAWSPGGRRALRALLSAPPNELGQIRARQALMQRLASWSDADGAQLGRCALDVEVYLSGNLFTLPARLPELWLLRWRDEGILHRLLYGIGAVRALLHLADELAARAFGSLGAQTNVAELAAIREGIAHPVCQALLATGPAAISLRHAHFDERLRGEARPAVSALLESLHQLDAMQSLARATSGPRFCVPELVDDGAPSFHARGLYHPLVSEAVGNDLSLDATGRVVFLTGPNMAGKTTLLRACGLAVTLAHAGAAVPASFARIGVVDRLFASIVVRDRIGRGESYYLAEVRRVAFLAQCLARGERVVALVDELFKGTNVHDALDATQLVTEGLMRAPRLICMLSSHLSELGERLPAEGPLLYRRLDASVSGEELHFDFRLRNGVSSQRLGMELLRREGIPQALAALAEPELPGRGPAQ